MRKTNFLIVLAVACAAAAAQVAFAQSGGPKAAGDAVRAEVQAFIKATAARDSAAVANSYAPDAVFLPPNLPRLEGRAAIAALWAGLFKDPNFGLELQSDRLEISRSGDLVVDVGTYQFRSSGPDGKAVTDRGKYVTASRRVEGRWLLVVDTFNSDGPAPAATSGEAKK